MTIEAANKRKKELVYMAAYLDPHTAAELSLDDIKSLCDDLFTAHEGWLPEYK
jgi:alpha-galactosidase